MLANRNQAAVAARRVTASSADRYASAVASFLDDVGELTEPPARITMVLLKRPEYRAMLEGFLELRRSALVRMNEPAVDAPLESLPHLYETWGVLEIIKVLLELAPDHGYIVERERMSMRSTGDLWIRVLPDGQAAVVLRHPESGQRVSVFPQRTYSGSSSPHSISFNQRPDITIEVRRQRQTTLYIFDPKYKLDSDGTAGDEPTGKPKKTDIDAMHSYRDSIRDDNGHRVVRAPYEHNPTTRWA